MHLSLKKHPESASKGCLVSCFVSNHEYDLRTAMTVRLNPVSGHLILIIRLVVSVACGREENHLCNSRYIPGRLYSVSRGRAQGAEVLLAAVCSNQSSNSHH